MKQKLLPMSFLLAIAAILIVAGCTVTGPSGPGGTTPGTYTETSLAGVDKPVNTKTFSSVEEYTNFVQQYSGGGYGYGYYGLGNAMMKGGVMMESAVQMDMVAAPTADGGEESYRDYSETNVQVAGIDEADIIKTDGDYIYTITDSVVFIIKAYPGEDAEVVEKIDFDENYPTGLFISGDYLAVFGNYQDLDFFKDIDFRPQYGMTFFNIYDISDKEDPELVKEYKFEGSYSNARMVDDYVYFVTNTQTFYRRVYPTPIMFDGAKIAAMPVSDIYYFDIPYRNPQLVGVHAIDIKNPSSEVNYVSVAVEWDQNLYMSKDNIFVTYTEQINEYELYEDIIKDLLEDELTDTDKALIEKIKKTDNEVLSFYEKKSKIMQIYYSYMQYMSQDEQEDLQDEAEELLKQKMEEYKHLEYTVINRISVDDGEIDVEANGKVPGHIINQFSMDEYKNVFRIATTISPTWSRFDNDQTESTNNVYALDQDMEIMGELEGLAEGEQIYSTRFIGERLYMVTFEQVDPFFVIDLSDPTDIEELGKLKIPGFSRYLHPYDEDTIIGIGRDASSTGRQQGLKISLFDVSDVEDPEEIAKFVTDERYVQSTAEFEHKAFLFDREKELLVIPAYNYDYGWDENGRRTTGEGYNGAFVFKINKDEIELRGLIDHSKAGDGSGYYYQPMVERSLWINELLYTKSPHLLRINELEDLSSVKNVDLKTGSSSIPVY